MISRWLVLVSLCGLVSTPLAAHSATGQMKGGIQYSLPSWFKQSFLNFPDDVQEAAKHGKQVLVFMHLEECPYCARSLEENFTRGEVRDFIEKHFDVVAVNIRGELETVWIDGVTRSERELARHVKVFGTPTMVFLGVDGRPALSLIGYRDPKAVRHALYFVQARQYEKQSFADYLAAHDKSVNYRFRDHPQFVRRTDFSGINGPLAVIFEDVQCAECARFHDKTLQHPDVLAEMKKFEVVRLDANATTPIVDIAGKSTTPAQWAKSLGLTYRPGTALFNEGKQILLIDARYYHFHYKEALRFVSGQYYKQYPTKSHYNAARRQELLGQGIDINYAE